MPMKRHIATSLAVPAGAELVVTVGGETFVHRVPHGPRVETSVEVEIGERIPDLSRPEIGAPSLAEHVHKVAEMGLKTRG